MYKVFGVTINMAIPEKKLSTMQFARLTSVVQAFAVSLAWLSQLALGWKRVLKLNENFTYGSKVRQKATKYCNNTHIEDVVTLSACESLLSFINSFIILWIR